MGESSVSRPRAFLTLVRHAESQANVDRVLQGVTDAPISARGEEQLKKLETAWRPGAKPLLSNAYQLPSPTLIVTSPLGRARKTSNAIARGCGITEVLLEDSTTFRSPPCTAPAPQAHECVLVDAGLSERNFGGAENTRKSEPVAGYARPPRGRVGRAESHSQFEKRVKTVGFKWIKWLKDLTDPPRTDHKASQAVMSQALADEPPVQDETDAEPPAPALATATPADNTQEVLGDVKESGNSETRDSFSSHTCTTGVPVDIPHLVLVSHGQWINAFLTHHFPELRQGSDAFYIRSMNTALFTIELGHSESTQPLQLVRKNDTSHLGPAVPRPTKRRATQATRLTDLWHARDGVELVNPQ
ncbi:Hypothetical protein MSYG_1394 [Malassezia sympodialis ATCC 42132]|uniref:Uncharacterized protein n=1 Tax=Malassezia sympodialis (strain ATCC 42132) TaxID=1230383 RepID=A0A1M8A4G2_MALS4|nr:Hypothetical protein MSYG_1394 [Malassezia sympodialis ATCC 42132]